MTGSLAHLDLRQLAETVRCPRCCAAVGETCWNTSSGETLHAPAHWQRIRAAETNQENPRG